MSSSWPSLSSCSATKRHRGIFLRAKHAFSCHGATQSNGNQGDRFYHRGWIEWRWVASVTHGPFPTPRDRKWPGMLGWTQVLHCLSPSNIYQIVHSNRRSRSCWLDCCAGSHVFFVAWHSSGVSETHYLGNQGTQPDNSRVDWIYRTSGFNFVIATQTLATDVTQTHTGMQTIHP